MIAATGIVPPCVGPMDPGDPPPTFATWSCLPSDPGGTFDSICGPRPALALTEDSAAPTHGPGSWLRPSQDDPPPAQGTPTPADPPYVVIRRVGRGGFGEVWEAVQTALNRKVAIKHLHLKAEDEQEARELEQLFRHEAFTTAALDHPNIVPVYDFGTDAAGRPMMAMKLVRGKNWDTVLRADVASLSTAELLAKHLQILASVAQAVVFAHDAGVIHRDIKPAQVMLGPYGEVLLMDWGLAILIDAPGEDSPLSAHERERIAPRATHASSPAGTPAYMAPEQTYEDASRIGPWTDVYLLGGILYFILTGARPHESATAAHAFELARSGAIVPPAERAPDRVLPPDLVDLAMRALEPSPERRTLTARAFHEAILDHLLGASRRRESIALAADALQRADPMPADYSALSDIINDLDRARMLWPENPAAGEGRERCLAALSRLSIDQEDLMLARATVNRLGDPAQREALSREVDEASAARQRRERERKRLRRKVAHERNVALQARARAEELLGFMLGDLRERLEPLGRISILDTVVTRARGYLEGLPESEQDRTARLQRIRTEAQIAAIERARGDLDRGLAILNAQAPLAEALLAADPQDARAMAAAAEVQAQLGRILTEKGLIEAAGKAKARARDLFQDLMLAEPGERRWAREFVRIATTIADDTVIQSRLDEGIRAYDETLLVVAQWQQREPDAREWAYAAANLHLHVAITLGLAVKHQEAIARTEQGLALLGPIVQSDRQDLEARKAAASLLMLKGCSLNPLGRTEECLQCLRGSAEELSQVCRLEPSNREWYTDLIQAKWLLGEALITTNRAEEAVPLLIDCAEQLEKEIADKPENILWSRDLGIVTQMLAKHHADKEEWEAGAREAARAAKAFDRLWRQDRSIKTYWPLLNRNADVLLKCARGVSRLGRTSRITAELQSLADLTSLMGESEPDNPVHLERHRETLGMLAAQAAESGRHAEAAVAIRNLDELIADSPGCKAGEPGSLAARMLTSHALHALDEEAAGALPQAAGLHERAAECCRECAAAIPPHRGHHLALGAQHLTRAAMLRARLGDLQHAGEDLEHGERMLEAAAAPGEGPLGSPHWKHQVGIGLKVVRGQVLRARGDASAATAMLVEAVEAARPEDHPRDARLLGWVAMAHGELGRHAEAQAIIDELERDGVMTEALRRSLARPGG